MADAWYRRGMRTPSLLVRRAAALGLFAVAAAACTGPANYPDRSDVSAAQTEWCTALAKSEGQGPSWEHFEHCRTAYPAASAPYIRGMQKCFFERVTASREGGDAAVDRSQMLQDCNEKVLLDLPESGPGVEEVLDARCERIARCEKSDFAECKAAFKRLEAAQQAQFTTVYNGAALHEIASCLSGGCSDNEEAARDACYKPLNDKLLWFP
jgi:hypothetical protein